MRKVNISRDITINRGLFGLKCFLKYRNGVRRKTIGYEVVPHRCNPGGGRLLKVGCLLYYIGGNWTDIFNTASSEVKRNPRDLMETKWFSSEFKQQTSRV